LIGGHIGWRQEALAAQYNRWRFRIGLLFTVCLLFGGTLPLPAQASQPSCGDLVLKSALINSFASGFTRAVAPYSFTFPADYGIHPAFQLEWWYYTGNLTSSDGRRFGYQFTIFRYGIIPPSNGQLAERDDLFAADLAISDVEGQQFLAQRIPPSFGPAGVSPDVPLHIWVRNWQMTAQDAAAKMIHLQASTALIGIDLTTLQIKPPALNGDHGLSIKGPLPGEASYYYSLTRLPTTGSLTINGASFQVTGNSWMDHEFSTGALDKNAQGWDWFSLQLDNNRELMIYFIRNQDGSIEPASQGTFVDAEGTTQTISLTKIQVQTLTHWTSPQSGVSYPSGWRITIQNPSFQLTVTPLLADQEQRSIITYWEGAVSITGSDAGQAVTGSGYVELTGYLPANCGTS
jgi:predicted secreted hydrolase